MGGVAETSPSSSHIYSQSQALQLKLYQAFIFSIPILFSIILFLLFYLFYLKRRASSISYLHPHPPQLLPRTSHPAPTTAYVSPLCLSDLKLEFVDKLPKILFDDELRARDPQCCVCLGEFEVAEKLLQIPYCKHVFHVECISHWLQSNWTCPLCRCSVIPTKVLHGNAAVSLPSPTSTLMELQPIQQEQVVTRHNPPLPINNSASFPREPTTTSSEDAC